MARDSVFKFLNYFENKSRSLLFLKNLTSILLGADVMWNVIMTSFAVQDSPTDVYDRASKVNDRVTDVYDSATVH